MDFPKSRAVVENLEFVPETGSTNRDLLSRSEDLSLNEFSVLVTDFQTLGRGRLERSWEAAPQSSIIASILLRPNFSNPEGLGWITMATALAIKKVTESILPSSAHSLVKWPNDVLVDGLKVSGILAELSPNLKAVVVGFGINVHQLPEELAFPSATSLRALGATSLDRDAILASILLELRVLYQKLQEADGDADLSGLRKAVIAASGTIGREVEATLPNGEKLIGLGHDIDSAGRLVILAESGPVTLSAGDIQHLRSR